MNDYWNVESEGHIGWEGTKELISKGEKVYRAYRSESFDTNGYRIGLYEDEYTKSVCPYMARINYERNLQTFPEMLPYLISGNRKDFPKLHTSSSLQTA